MKDSESKDYFALRFLDTGLLMEAGHGDPRLFTSKEEAVRFGRGGIACIPVPVRLTVLSDDAATH